MKQHKPFFVYLTTAFCQRILAAQIMSIYTRNGRSEVTEVIRFRDASYFDLLKLNEWNHMALRRGYQPAVPCIYYKLFGFDGCVKYY